MKNTNQSKPQKNLIITAIAFLSSVLFLPNAYTAIDQKINEESWVTNGDVNSTVILNNTLYLGGSFTRVGTYSGGSVPFDINTGQAHPSFPKVRGTVYTIISDENGGWYIGGNFFQVGTFKRNNLAHILSNLTVDSNWAPEANNIVLALAMKSSKIFVGGRFNVINSVAQNYISRLNMDGTLDLTWSCNTDSWVRSIAISDSMIFIGGDFTQINGAIKKYVAALNFDGSINSNWNVDISMANANAKPAINVLVINGSTLYFGGQFNSVNSVSRNNLAAVNFDSTLSEWNPNITGNEVLDMSIFDTSMIIAGDFNKVGVSPKSGLALVDLFEGDPYPDWNPAFSGRVLSVKIVDSILYVGGEFSSINGVARLNLASLRLDKINNPTLTSWNPDSNYAVFDFGTSSQYLLVGGVLSSIGGAPRNRLAAIDLQTGQPKNWAPQINNDVYLLAGTDSTLFISGNFSEVEGQAMTRLAAFNVATGNLHADWKPNPNGTIFSLGVFGNSLYVGGDFTIGQAKNLVAFNSDTLERKITFNSPLETNSVKAFTVYKSTLVISEEDVTNRKFRITGLNRETGETLAGRQIEVGGGFVRALLTKGQAIYLAGDFLNIGDSQGPAKAAAINADTWKLLPFWNPKIDNNAYSLAADDNFIYIGGEFTGAGAQIVKNIAQVDPDTGTPTDWRADVPNRVEAIHLNKTKSIMTLSARNGLNVRDRSYYQFGKFTGIISPPVVSTPSIVGLVSLDSVDSLNIYPNPFIPGKGTDDITFGNIPEGTHIKVYDVTGSLITGLTADSTNSAVWRSLRNDSGNIVAGGIYFVIAEGHGTKKTMLAIER